MPSFVITFLWCTAPIELDGPTYVRAETIQRPSSIIVPIDPNLAVPAPQPSEGIQLCCSETHEYITIDITYLGSPTSFIV